MKTAYKEFISVSVSGVGGYGSSFAARYGLGFLNGIKGACSDEFDFCELESAVGILCALGLKYMLDEYVFGRTHIMLMNPQDGKLVDDDNHKPREASYGTIEGARKSPTLKTPG